MGLNNKYKTYSQDYQDQGLEKLITLPGGEYMPDFENRNTIQVWDITNAVDSAIVSWVGTTLVDRSLHEIKIINGSAVEKSVSFTTAYSLIDEVFETVRNIDIGAGGSAHFYCTGIHDKGNLVLAMRGGSQNDRKL